MIRQRYLDRSPPRSWELPVAASFSLGLLAVYVLRDSEASYLLGWLLGAITVAIPYRRLLSAPKSTE